MQGSATSIICTKRTFVVDHIYKFNYIRDTEKYNLKTYIFLIICFVHKMQFLLFFQRLWAVHLGFLYYKCEKILRFK